MDKLRIVGGQRLQGAVTISGAKNAALPEIAASLLSPYPLELTNLPVVSDVDNMLGVVGLHGAIVSRSGHAATIDTGAAVSRETSYDTVRKMRATVLVLAPLLARFGHARVSLPGGCAIGARPVDMHLKTLAALGANIGVENGLIVASAPNGLSGARIVLASPSVGATETAIMAATAARGETEILNAAREPEVADLAACLSAMGARIEGSGTHASWSAATRRGGRRRTRSFPTVSRPVPMPSQRPSPVGNSNSLTPGWSTLPPSCRCWKRPEQASGPATAA